MVVKERFMVVEERSNVVEERITVVVEKSTAVAEKITMVEEWSEIEQAVSYFICVMHTPPGLTSYHSSVSHRRV